MSSVCNRMSLAVHVPCRASSASRFVLSNAAPQDIALAVRYNLTPCAKLMKSSVPRGRQLVLDWSEVACRQGLLLSIRGEYSPYGFGVNPGYASKVTERHRKPRLASSLYSSKLLRAWS